MVLTLRYKAGVAVLAFILAIALSYLSIRATLASYYANQGTLEGYEKATHLEPTNSENWLRLGDFRQYDLQHADTERAIEAYRNALSLNPNLVDAWLGLASVYEGEGKSDAARGALLSAKRVYPASADVCWQFANFLLRNGELNQALGEARQAVESEPRRAWETVALFQRFDPDVDELSERLLPHQEIPYLDVIWGLNVEGRPSEALKVWDRLFALDKAMPQHSVPSGSYQLTQKILFSLVDQLLSKGYISQVDRVWDEVLAFMNLPRQRDPSDSLVWDGGFETDFTGGLAWRIDAPSGAEVRFSKAIMHSGRRALEIKFDGKHNVDFHGVYQFVVVEPDTEYDFSGWLRTKNITTDRGISLRLSTPQNGASELATPEFTGTHPWTQVGFRWHSPKGVHLAQISLVRRKSYNLYNTIAGTVWVDDVQMVPIKLGTDSFDSHRIPGEQQSKSFTN